MPPRFSACLESSSHATTCRAACRSLKFLRAVVKAWWRSSGTLIRSHHENEVKAMSRDKFRPTRKWGEEFIKLVIGPTGMSLARVPAGEPLDGIVIATIPSNMTRKGEVGASVGTVEMLPCGSRDLFDRCKKLRAFFGDAWCQEARFVGCRMTVAACLLFDRTTGSLSE